MDDDTKISWNNAAVGERYLDFNPRRRDYKPSADPEILC